MDNHHAADHEVKAGNLKDVEAGTESACEAKGREMPQVRAAIRDEIQAALTNIEDEHDVTILYACESGSRAWGFESTDSDYDVRFLYMHRTPWYLTITPGRNVIERPLSDDLDLSGWDLRKALALFQRSNPPLLEWIQSPIVYRSKSRLAGALRQLLPGYYSPTSCMHHYLHMAEGNMRDYLNGDTVWTKKYFYVLRPVLACLWLEQGRGVVPTEFYKLVDAIVQDEVLRREIEALLEAKKSGNELRRGPRNEIISSFVETQISRLKAAGPPTADAKHLESLNHLFLQTLLEVNGTCIEPQ